MQYLHLAPSGTLPDLAGLRPFKAVVIIASPVTPERQTAISQWLVESGCLYMMAWGDGAAAWEASVQLANRESFPTPEIPDESLVITTWHKVEPLKDVFWFAKHTAMHPCCKIDHVLLVHLSMTEREQELCAEYADT
jgi:hypothetical protein